MALHSLATRFHGPATTFPGVETPFPPAATPFTRPPPPTAPPTPSTPRRAGDTPYALSSLRRRADVRVPPLSRPALSRAARVEGGSRLDAAPCRRARRRAAPRRCRRGPRPSRL